MMVKVSLLTTFLWVHFVNGQFSLDSDDSKGNKYGSTFKSCKTKDNRDGLCVPWTYCNEAHEILEGGDIHGSEYRESVSRQCPLLSWCCTKEETKEPPVLNDKKDKCLSLDSDICQWCVKLYKTADLKELNTHVFCMGALIGSQVVLTSATCLKTAQYHKLYVRAPYSGNPEVSYVAKHIMAHPSYNTGTHLFDFGIIVLENKVEWKPGATRGACLNFDELGGSGSCITFGFDNNDNVVSTMIRTSAGACKNSGGGGSADVFCGKSKDRQCFAAPGAPVVCQTDVEEQNALLGVVRSGCPDGRVALGGIAAASQWLRTWLDDMKVDKNVFTL